MKIIPAVRRKALIIHNSGDASHFLKGVSVDIANICRFLLSNYGGAWEDNEITVAPDNSTAEWLENYFRNAGLVDYYLIFYTGHGSYDEEKGPVYWLNHNEGIYNAWLQDWIGENTTTMLISDSCQVIEELEKGGILESRTFSAVDLETDRAKCRKLYNDVLRKLPKRNVCRGIICISRRRSSRKLKIRRLLYSLTTTDRKGYSSKPRIPKWCIWNWLYSLTCSRTSRATFRRKANSLY